jgi:hypothetical protein
MEVKKIAAIEKNCLLDRIVAKVQTSKNNRNRKAKKQPPTLNPKKIATKEK